MGRRDTFLAFFDGFRRFCWGGIGAFAVCCDAGLEDGVLFSWKILRYNKSEHVMTASYVVIVLLLLLCIRSF